MRNPPTPSTTYPTWPSPPRPARLRRVAFYGRVGHDHSDGTAEAALAAQYHDCGRVLLAGEITAVFFDFSPADARHRPPPGDLAIGCALVPRHGGLADLLNEANTPQRRFDYVIATGPDRLSRDVRQVCGQLRRLDQAGVEFLIPGDRGDALPLMSLIFLRTLGDLVADAWRHRGEDRTTP